MALILTAGSSNYAPPPEGLHIAVCAAVVDLGLRDGPWGRKHQIQIIWQFLHNGERFNISGWYNYTLNTEKSNLRKVLQSWFGKRIEDGVKINFDKLEGKGCQVQIIHEEKGEMTKAQISAVLPLSEGMIAPTPEPDDYIQKVIEGAKENVAASGNGADPSVAAQYAKGDFGESSTQTEPEPAAQATDDGLPF